MSELNLKELLNKQVTLTGIARDAKGGAALLVNDIPIYIKGLISWPDEHFGKILRVRGILREEKLIPDPIIDKNGAISQGAIGKQDVLENAEVLK